MKKIEDLKMWFHNNYIEVSQEAIKHYLASVVASKYHLHDDADSFIGSEDYYDVEVEVEFSDLIVEDNSTETLLFHCCFQIVYDELYCNPHSLVDVYHCYKERGIHAYVGIDFVGYDWDAFRQFYLVPDSVRTISKQQAQNFRREYSGAIIYNWRLLPEINSENRMKQVVDIMLKRYYPGYSSEYTVVDPELLTQSLGLDLIRVSYLPGMIEGIIYFEDGVYTSAAKDADIWKYYLDENDILVPDKLAQYEVKAGTIVLTSTSHDRENNTLAHECCHWFLHRKPYLLQILLGEEPPKISCRQNTMSGRANGEYIEQREWQASNLSPRVLLANRSVDEEIVRRVKEKRKLESEKILPDLIRDSIEDFSMESPLSRGGILVQLKKVYCGLDGILPCPERWYIRPYLYSPTKLGKNETFDISEDNYKFLYGSSEDLRRLIDSGLFIFVENHVCRVTGNSIYIDEFEPMLTDEARLHMEKYCIKFRKQRNSQENYKFTINGAFRYITKEINEKLKLFDAGDAMPGDDVWEAATKGMQDISDVQAEMTQNIKHDLPILFEWSEKTKYRVSEDADLDKHTFPDLLSGKTKTMKPKTAIQLCIGMQLPYELSKCLLKAANIEFDGSPLHMAYSWIIKHLTFEPIEEANKFLVARSLPPLGRA